MLASLLGIMLLISALMLIPAVQNRLAQEGVAWVNDKYALDLELEKLRYQFPNKVVLEDLYLPDSENDTLIFLHSLDFAFYSFKGNEQRLRTGEVVLDGLNFNLVKHAGDSLTNFMKVLEKFSSGEKKQQTPFKLDLSQLKITNSRFAYHQPACDSCTEYDLEKLNLNLLGAHLNGTSAYADIQTLSFNNQYGIKLENLRGEVYFSDTALGVNNLELRTPLTNLRAHLELNYPSLGAFSSFVDSVNFRGRFEESRLDFADIRYFSDQVPPLGAVHIEGLIKGKVGDLKARRLNLAFAERSSLQGSFDLTNVTNPQNLNLRTNDLTIKTQPEDIRWLGDLFAEVNWPEQLAQLGQIVWRGSYQGGLDNLRSDFDLQTAVGSVRADLKLLSLSDPEALQYEGNLKTDSLALGQLLQSPLLGNLSLDLFLEGKGIQPRSMKTTLQGEVSQFDFKDYRYQNIQLDGAIAKGSFDGAIRIDDPNLKLDFLGEASFDEDTSRYDFVTKIDTARLYALNFTSDSLSELSARIDIDFTAANLDRFEGQVKVEDIYFRNERSAYHFDTLLIESSGFSKEKSIDVSSRLINGKLTGQYTFAGIAQAFQRSLQRFYPAGDTAVPPVIQNFEWNFNFANPNLLTEVFIPELSIAQGTTLKGRFRSEEQKLRIELNSRALSYQQNEVEQVAFNLASADTGSSLDLKLQSLSLATGLEIDSIRFDNAFEKDTLRYTLSGILRDSIDSRINLGGYAQRSDTALWRIGLSQANFNVGQKQFFLPKTGVFLIDSNEYQVEGLTIASGEERLHFNGFISKDPSKSLELQTEGFHLGLLNYFIANPSTHFKGYLQGEVKAKELLGQPSFLADMKVDSMELNERKIGTLSLNSNYELGQDTIGLKATLVKGKLTTMSAKGYYSPKGERPVKLDLKFDRFQLAALNPVVASVARNLRGMLDGNIAVRGSLNEPSVNGQLKLPKVAFTISFLGADYTLTNDPVIRINDNAISFPDLELVDRKFGKALLSGEVRHNHFSDFDLDLKLTANELLVLDTEPNVNDAYYGTAFTSGTIRLQGPPARMSVFADVRSEKNTEFNIPIGGATEVQRSRFVEFVKPKSEEQIGSKKPRAIAVEEGVSLDFDIEVDQNAQVAIILDQSAGSKMQAKGQGQIKLKLGASGDMELFGTYTVNKGFFNFNLQNLVSKRFELMPGGTVNWNGDPYDARLDVTAIYTTKADPTPFLGEVGGSSNTLTEVYLKVSGALSDPEIAFDIKTPRANSTTQAMLSNRIAEEEARNQQVFSLLAFNTFTPQSNIFSGSGQGINEWDLLANQAAAFVNRFTGDYQVTLDYSEAPTSGQTGAEGAPADPNNSGELEVGLSKDFFDERLTISSSLGVPLGSEQNSIAGDFEVSYALTPDGRLRATAFTRAVDDQFNISLGQQQLYQQGLGLSYRVDFDSFRALLKRWLGQDKARREEEQQSSEEAAKQEKKED